MQASDLYLFASVIVHLLVLADYMVAFVHSSSHFFQVASAALAAGLSIRE